MSESASRFIKIGAASIVLAAALFILLAFLLAANKPYTPPDNLLKGMAILVTIFAVIEPIHITTGQLGFIFGNNPRKFNVGHLLNLFLAVSVIFQAFF